jgi:hypothetical protein
MSERLACWISFVVGVGAGLDLSSPELGGEAKVADGSTLRFFLLNVNPDHVQCPCLNDPTEMNDEPHV